MSGQGNFDSTVDSGLDETFDALSDAKRRFVMRYLDREGSTSLSTLAERLAAEDDDTTTVSVTHDQRRTATIRLHHVHLPKLETADLVELSSEDDLVEPTDRLSSLLTALPADYGSGDSPSPGESAALD
jgi:hypothetical protein